MIAPLDIERLAGRIERLIRTSTAGWHSGDELEFRNLLPTGHDRRKVPEPKWLREHTAEVTVQQYQFWNQMMLRMEGLVRDNDPRNPKRMMRDMARGKLPFPLR